MVVIVIRVPSEDKPNGTPTVTYRTESDPKSKPKNGYDSLNETGPPSYDSGVNTDPEPRDLKLFLRENRTVYDRAPRIEQHDPLFTRLESSSKDSGFCGYAEYQRLKDLELLREIHERNKNELRLESPVSKDSGFSDKIRPCKITKIRYYSRPDSREKNTSCTYLSSRSSQPDTDSNTVTNFSCSSQADPENSVATTKEEEWVTKKKVEVTTKRQIETRVKRQVVLEDGKVVEDSGPIVTTNTTEDTEKQEHNQTEHRTSGDDPPGEDWVAIPGPGGLVKEVKEKTVKSREETEERLETEGVQHLGDISDEGYLKAVTSGQSDVRTALEISNRKELVETSPKIIHQSSKTKKIIDTEDKRELSEVQPDGKVITETKRTTEHEEIRNANLPDDKSDGRSVDESTKKESSHKYRKTKDQDLTEYRVNGVKIGQKMRFQAETSEAERHGDPMEIDQLDSLSTRLRRMRLRSQNHKLALEGGVPPLERKDVLTKKPLNFDLEEETRKVETSKWLEHHFGSESTKSSKGSLDDLVEQVPAASQNSFINVTMKSRPIISQKTKLLNSSDEDKPFKSYNKLEAPREIFISSPECDSPTNNGYFKGISHWDSRKQEEKQTTINRIPVQSSPPDSPPYLITSHRINPVPLKSNFRSERTSPPLLERKNLSNGISKGFTNYRDSSPSPPHRPLRSSPEENHVPSPPLRRKKETNGYKVDYDFRSWDRRQKQEPKPDYTPPSRSPSPEIRTVELPANKKLYQRTRFAADIPPPQPRPYQIKQKSKIGESFRKFVGKLRSSSSERKNKKRIKNGESRSPSPKENTYQNYNIVDSNIPSVAGRVGRDEMGEPVAPPRGRPYKLDNGSLVDSGTQTKVTGDMERRGITRYYLGEDPFSGSIYGREKEYDGVTPLKTSRRHKIGSSRKVADEIHSSTLGRLSKSTSRLVNSEVRTNNSYDYDRGGVQTLPRKLRDDSNNYKRPVEAQRSLGETTSLSPNHWEYSRSNFRTKRNSPPHANSMINVSFVNQVSPPSSNIGMGKHNGIPLNGPAKPARTYRSNLSRSKSFNVQIEEPDYKYRDPYKSNPQLHRLEESPPPLKSPGIISSLNRSSRDVTNEGFNFSKTDEKRKLFMKGLLDRAPELFKTIHGEDEIDGGKKSNKIYTSTPIHKDKKRVIDYSNSFHSTSTNDSNRRISSPYYKSSLLNGNDRIASPSPKSSLLSQSPSFREIIHDGNTTKSVVRRGSDDDYSETIRITSKSDDPLRPSESNTVQTFSKKKVPSKNGLSTETIQSSETKTVTKSRFSSADAENGRKYSRNSPGGVVIEVRNLK